MEYKELKNMSDILKLEKERRKLTLTEFAEELGLSRSRLYEFINGTGNPRWDTIALVASKLEMEPLDLLSKPPAKPES